MEQRIDVLELGRWLEGQEPPAVLDVRRRVDLFADPRRIPGAQWRDPESIERWVDTVDRDLPVVVYGARGGAVGRGVAQELGRRGFTARWLAGGLAAWLAKAAMEGRTGNG